MTENSKDEVVMSSRAAAGAAPVRSCPDMSNTGPSLDAVLEAVEAAADSRAERVAKDVRAFARGLRLHPASIPADPRKLRVLRTKLEVPPARLSRKRIQNLMSSVATALRMAGLLPDRLPDHVMTEQWRRLLRRDGRCSRWRFDAVVPFGRFCSSAGVEPPDVGPEVLERYRDHLDRTSLSKCPRKVLRSVISGWNGLAAASDLPLGVLSLDIEESRAAPLEELPAALAEEIKLYRDRCGLPPDLAQSSPSGSADDLLQRIRTSRGASRSDAAGRKRKVKPLREATLQLHVYVLRRLATWTLRNRDDVPQSIPLLLSSDLAFAWAVAEGALADNPRPSLLANVAALRDIARRVGATPQHVEDLAGLVSDLQDKMPEQSPRVTEHLAQYDDPAILRQVYRLPLLEFRRLETRRRTGTLTGADLLDMQFVAMIAVLFCCPLRRRSLASLTVEQVETAVAADAAPVITIDGNHVKTGQAITMELDRDAITILRAYLKHYRTAIVPDLDTDASFLFPSQDGTGSRPPDGISRLIRSRFRRLLRLEASSHTLRYLMAMLLFEHTNSKEAVQALLRHGNRTGTWWRYVRNGQRVGSRKLSEAREMSTAPAGRKRRNARTITVVGRA